MDITSIAAKIRLAAFQLEGDECLVYNMMFVACCVHLCVFGYIWKTRNTRVRTHT